MRRGRGYLLLTRDRLTALNTKGIPFSTDQDAFEWCRLQCLRHKLENPK